MGNEERDCVWVLGEEGEELDVVGETAVFDLGDVVGEGVNAGFGFSPVISILPSLLSFAKPFVCDTEVEVVFDVRNLILVGLRTVRKGLAMKVRMLYFWSNLGQLQQLLEVIEVFVRNMGLEWLQIQRSFAWNRIERHAVLVFLLLLSQ